jgi:16S rRNA (guanine527-N7)-methyltransferase
VNEAEFCRALADRARQIGIRVEPPEQQRMFVHFQLLARWNQRINLTTITQPDEIVTGHFVDSLVLADIPDAGARVLDLGTGAGFPGLPLAVIRRDLTVVLSEAHAKKREFLEQAIRLLGLDKVTVIRRSTEYEDESRDGEPTLRDSFDYIAARALGPFERLLRFAAPLLRDRGTILAMKGPKVFREIEAETSAIEMYGFTAKILRETLLPESGKRRFVVALRRQEP